jgi:hypothetical protein
MDELELGGGQRSIAAGKRGLGDDPDAIGHGGAPVREYFPMPEFCD